MNENYIKFWGVRGSRSTAEMDKMGFGGDTSCVEIRSSNNDLIILDMGTGLTNLGEMLLNESSPPKNIHIFLSHYHWDHILGFLTFMPIYNEQFQINIYGNNKKTSINDISKKLLDKTFWPVSIDMLKAKINFKELNDNDTKINDITIKCSDHIHPNGATSYKIIINNTKIVYTTDCEHPNKLNKSVISFAQDSDFFIHDAHFTPEDLLSHAGWGHSSWEEATKIAKEANVSKLILFHYSPNYNDDAVKKIEGDAKKHFQSTIAAKQGLKITF